MRVAVHIAVQNIEHGGIPVVSFTITTGEVISPKLSLRDAIQLQANLEDAIKMHLKVRRAVSEA